MILGLIFLMAALWLGDISATQHRENEGALLSTPSTPAEAVVEID